MSRATWLVTGGCGFIGSHLADALIARGDNVRILDDLSSGTLANLSPGATLLRGSVTDQALVRRALEGADGCFHLAAIASVRRCEEDWVGSHATNQTGTVTVLDAARRAGGAPVVFASSAAVYAPSAPMPLAEHATATPAGPYGADKLGSETHARIAAERFGVPTLGMRFFNVYGPRQDGQSPYSGVISIFCEQIARGAALTIRGDGRQTRDFVYVDDVVAALIAGMRALPDAPRVVNVCTGEAVSIAGLARTLCAVRRCSPGIEHLPSRADDVRASCGDPSMLARRLGVSARVRLADGLLRTVTARDALRGAA